MAKLANDPSDVINATIMQRTSFPKVIPRPANRNLLYEGGLLSFGCPPTDGEPTKKL
ncbi:MAG TPA: hypothetical protein VI893_09950 [Thermoplasmata archaeon]|nr:hypothetical protein [Thermoplasmata archaeon]